MSAPGRAADQLRRPDRDREPLIRAITDVAEGVYDGLTLGAEDRWGQEIGFLQAHLEQFADLPEEIWESHRRIAKALGE